MFWNELMGKFQIKTFFIIVVPNNNNIVFYNRIYYI